MLSRKSILRLVRGWRLAVGGYQGKARGFTLIEVVVGSALMAIAMTIIAVIFLDSFVGQRKIIAFEQASSNARVLMDTLSREIRVSTICGDTGGVRPCGHIGNNTPAASPLILSTSLDIIKDIGGGTPVYISYCFRPIAAIPFDYAELRRIVNDENFTKNACDETDPASKVLNSPEVVLLIADSGFITRGIGQSPPGAGQDCQPSSALPAYDICQSRTTIMLHVQSITQRQGKERVDVQAQTTISQRLVDIP